MRERGGGTFHFSDFEFWVSGFRSRGSCLGFRESVFGDLGEAVILPVPLWDGRRLMIPGFRFRNLES
jgi:hypothetical protein